MLPQTSWNQFEQPLAWIVSVGASLAAVVFDLRTRRIPNLLTGPLALAGLAWAFWRGGPAGAGWALAAGVLLMLPFVVLFVFAGGGAGDAKLMAGLGIWLGVSSGLIVLAAVCLSGGVLALVLAVSRRQSARSAGTCWRSGCN